jgi:hypothetical protein
MAQDLTVNIKTTSDVPQAMDRAKTATTSFGKQVDDIQKKFSMAFKDVFLSFLGPLALLGIAINYIGKLIDENRKKNEDANQSAIDGTNALMSAEDKYWANRRKNEKKVVKDIEEAEVQRETTTREFLESDPRGADILKYAPQSREAGLTVSQLAFKVAKEKGVQDQVQALIAEDIKKNPAAGESDAEREERERAAKPSAFKPGTFKGPEGFGAVIGVGANPVIENMTKQTEIQTQLLKLMESLIPQGRPANAPDFTKAVPLTLQKSGLV